MSKFEYVVPQSLEGALQALAQASGAAVALAGGTTLLVSMRAGIAQPALVVDLRYLDDLKQVYHDGDTIQIGALTTLTMLEHSHVIRQEVPVLAEMAKRFGNPLVRSAATVGGNLALVSPRADTVVPLLALDAKLQLQASDGTQRDIALAAFCIDSGKSMLDSDELITRISIPTLTNSTRWYYYKLGRRKAGSGVIVSASIIVDLQGNRVQKARIALGTVAPRPFRAFQAEQVLMHEALNEKIIAKCVEVLETEIAPLDDIFASAAYRSSMAKALVARALKQSSVQ
jgi:CO/xanthine dehydrogenase FAD-binding subunit